MTRTKRADLIADASPFREKHKHPATRSFQAIRIYINSELEEIERALDSALEVLSHRPFIDHKFPLAGRPHRQTLYASPQPRRSGAGGHSVDRRATAQHGRTNAKSAGQNDAIGSGSGGQPCVRAARCCVLLKDARVIGNERHGLVGVIGGDLLRNAKIPMILRLRHWSPRFSW